ncbi:MAG: TolC family protein [Christiangramia sp.]|nr:transporter [Christiangramia sp.]
MKTMKLYILLAFVFFGITSEAQSVEHFLQIAAENNPEIQSAYSEFEAALQKSPQVSSLPDPTLTVSAFGRMMETRLGAQEARFSLMQMFPWFGTLSARTNSADLMAEAKFQEYLNTREKVFMQVKNAYADIYEAFGTIAAKNENLEILDSYRDLALNRFEAGNAPMVNVVKVDIQKDEAETEIEILKEELETRKDQLRFLINDLGDVEIAVQDTLVVEFDSFNEQDFTEHPRLAMLQKKTEAYQNDELVAEKNGLPNLGVGVDYSIISKRTDANPENNGQDAIMPMVSISLPIFRKKYRAQKEEARLMAQASEQQKEAVANELRSEFSMAKYQLKKSERLLELYSNQIEKSNQANKLLISGFSNSNSDFQEVLQMNSDILLYKIQQVSALAQAYKAAAKLEYLQYQNSDENE